jgi:hypothetical protein
MAILNAAFHFAGEHENAFWVILDYRGFKSFLVVLSKKCGCLSQEGPAFLGAVFPTGRGSRNSGPTRFLGRRSPHPRGNTGHPNAERPFSRPGGPAWRTPKPGPKCPSKPSVTGETTLTEAKSSGLVQRAGKGPPTRDEAPQFTCSPCGRALPAPSGASGTFPLPPDPA